MDKKDLILLIVVRELSLYLIISYGMIKLSELKDIFKKEITLLSVDEAKLFKLSDFLTGLYKFYYLKECFLFTQLIIISAFLFKLYKIYTSL